ncbi:hypothetical protein [Actinocorallia populi]|uniref:hypothetical protein n=1 Tax=Actinocorallia populi TaxID=2079200 RepID=UPI000D090375|nr:hypothetical protein [Actinocorallia populi]
MFAASPRTSSAALAPVALAAALAAAVLALPASASAAAKPCLLGKWKLTKYTLDAKGPGLSTKARGGQGIGLTVAKKSVTYDFNGSRPLAVKGISDGEKYDMKTTYSKRLMLESTLKGARKGSLALKPKSAKGGARAAISRNGAFVMSYSLVQNVYREGSWEPVAPLRSSYTCNAKTVTFRTTSTDDSGTGTIVTTYRRR